MFTKKVSRTQQLVVIFTLLALTFSPTGVTPAYAANIVVTSAANNGPGTLRQAIADAGNGGTITFDPSLSGATIYLASELQATMTLTIDGSALASRITISGDSDGNGSGDVRVFGFNGTITLKSLIITKGKTSGGIGIGDGAGIYNAGVLSLYNVKISNNDAVNAFGGGIVSHGNLTIDNCTIDNNYALKSGGGIYIDQGVLDIKNSTISDNSANSVIDGYGGGIASKSPASVFVTGSTISGNYSNLNGGGIYSYQSLIYVSKSTISGNSAPESSGGGINGAAEASIYIFNSTISGNSSKVEGGGILISALATLEVTDSTISGNSTDGFGGGIDNYGTAKITNSTVSANGTNGINANNNFAGGIFNVGSLTLTNSTIYGNSAKGDGGGITNGSSATANVYNTSILFNVANADDNGFGSAGGVYNLGTFNMRNTLIAGNYATGAAPIYDDCGGTIRSYGRDLIGAPYADYSGSCQVVQVVGTSAQLNNLSLLGGLQNNGGPTKTVALLAGSNAIDGGDPTYGCTDVNGAVILTDQRGEARAGARCDVGAYEAPSTFNNVSKWSSSFDLAHGWTVADYVRTVGDVNADDSADLIGFGSDGVYVALSNGTSFGAISKWSSSFDLAHGWTVASYVRTVGDVNNDGRADLIGFGSDGVYVALSNGTGFGAISKWSSSFDLAHGWTVASFVRTVGDVNNDGRADLIGFGSDGVYVALSNGTGFGVISKWSSSFDLAHGWTVASYVRTVGDVNNDGRADLIGFGSDGVYVALSNGAQFGSINKWSSSFDLAHGWTVASFVRTVGDVNFDGKDDLIGFGSDGVYVATAK